jgi:hypothetical protein
LVNDVADVLESIAVGPTHTPALYGNFLKALISAKLDPSATISQQHHHAGSSSANGIGSSLSPPSANTSASANASLGAGINASGGLASPIPGGEPSWQLGGLGEFNLDGEMGPVMDMSVFPPTMADEGQQAAMMGGKMDNILSSVFWDSVLVPG